MKTSKTSDPWALIIIVLTFGLFILALFVKGFTHDVIIEAAVFLVSLKLILMLKRNIEAEGRMEQHLTRIEELLLAHRESQEKP